MSDQEQTNEIINYAKEKLPNADFSGVTIEYIEHDKKPHSFYRLSHVIDSKGNERVILAYLNEEAAPVERIELALVDNKQWGISDL